MPKPEFQIGDLVVLKSGSPRMTVAAVSEGRCFVRWLPEGADVSTTEDYDSRLLEKFKKGAKS